MADASSRTAHPPTRGEHRFSPPCTAVHRVQNQRGLPREGHVLMTEAQKQREIQRTDTLTHSHTHTHAHTHSLLHSFTPSLLHSFTPSLLHSHTRTRVRVKKSGTFDCARKKAVFDEQDGVRTHVVVLLDVIGHALNCEIHLTRLKQNDKATWMS